MSNARERDRDKDRDRDVLTELGKIVGPTFVSSVDTDLDAYGGLGPAVVAWPASGTEIARLLQVCTDNNYAVGVSGAKTRSVHWGADDSRTRVALDTGRLFDILELDESSLVVHAQAGIKIDQLQQALHRHGLTLGSFSRDIYRSTLGGLLSDPPLIAYSPQAGRFADICVGVSVATPTGAVFQTRVAPRKATGPDLSRLYLGNRGALGVIFAAVLKVSRLPEAEFAAGCVFSSMESALQATRRIFATGIRPARLQVLNGPQAGLELETLGFPHSAFTSNSSGVFLTALSGPESLVQAQRRLVEEEVAAGNAIQLPQEHVDRWWQRERTQTGGMRPPVGIRIRYSQIASLNELLSRRDLRMRAEQFGLHGAILWLGATTETDDFERVLNSLEGVELTSEQANLPPLAEALRKELDPKSVLLSRQWLRRSDGSRA
jgi:FAD/FMN-containing dehydrogenase